MREAGAFAPSANAVPLEPLDAVPAAEVSTLIQRHIVARTIALAIKQ
jgi:hypothetical protein